MSFSGLSGPSLPDPPKGMTSEKDLTEMWSIFLLVQESHLKLGGGNSNIFYFHPDPWGNDPI